ncbi:Nn.00g046210.m01.CDS01 [Neocucurbitaria sp. VM-36]
MAGPRRAAALSSPRAVDENAFLLNNTDKCLRDSVNFGQYERFGGQAAVEPRIVADGSIVQTCKNSEPQARRSHSMPRSYRQLTVSDSDVSRDDPADADYVERQTVAMADQTLKQPVGADTNFSQARTKGTAQKRKAPTTEVIDLCQDTPSPSKQLKLDQIATLTVESTKPTAPSARLRIHNTANRPNPKLHPNAPQRDKPVQSVQPPPIRNALRAPQPQVLDKSVRGELDDLRYLVYSLVQERVESHKPLTPDMLQRLRSIRTSMQQEPGNLVQRLLSNLEAADAANASLLDQFRAMVGHQTPGTNPTFPPVPTQAEVDRGWQLIRKGVKDAFANELGLNIEGPTPEAVSAGYISSTIDDLLEDLRTRRTIFSKLRAHLKSPHLAQSLMSALFCRWLFINPDAMCEGKHSELTLKQYEAISLSDGLVEVQRIDKLGFSQLFADPDFHKAHLEVIAAKLIARFSETVTQAYPSAPGVGAIDESTDWVEGALKLKQRLMISPKEYRIHFCLPATPFDPTWMTAEDAKGIPVNAAQAKGKTISTCLFPALVEQNPKGYEKRAEIADVLIENKKFFPTWQEKHGLDPKTVISKAVVLVM